MKKLNLQFFSIILFVLIFDSCKTNRPPEIGDEEYKVYSAVLNYYFFEKSKTVYSISGAESNPPAFNIEQVVINSKTINTINEELSSKYDLRQIPQEVFADYSKKNDNIYNLENKFELPAKALLAEEETLNKELEKYLSLGAANPLAGKYRNNLGWIFFSRVGFDDSHRSALVSYFLKYPYDANIFPKKIVLLVKEDGEWRVQQSFPKEEETILTVNPEKCESDGMSYLWGMGSGSVNTNGLKSGKCHLTESREIEGSYTNIERFIPTDFDKFAVSKRGQSFYFSRNISGFCEKPKIGNLLIEQQKQLNKPK